MKTVLCVVSSLNAGGAETFLMKVLRTIDRTQYMFDFIVSADGIYDAEVLQLGSKIYKVSLRSKNPLKVFFEIKSIVKSNQYNYFLKLTDTPLTGIIDILAAKLGGAKRIMVRSCNASTNSSKLKEFLNFLMRPIFNELVDCKIAPSDLAASYTFGKKQVRNQKVHFVNNGVDLNIFKYNEANRQEIRREFSIPVNALLIGHVGRFTEQKNHEFLLKIFKEIHKLNENSYLLLVGTGELQEQILSIVNNSDFKEFVKFAGLRRDVPKILSAFDILLLPSFYEGMPNVIIEGQATGLPCIISDTITREANITGLVQYLSLKTNVFEWANVALDFSECNRADTKDKFVAAKYDIQSVSESLIKLLFQDT